MTRTNYADFDQDFMVPDVPGAPVDATGEPIVPPKTDAEILREIEMADALEQSPPEHYVPSAEDWAEFYDSLTSSVHFKSTADARRGDV